MSQLSDAITNMENSHNKLAESLKTTLAELQTKTAEVPTPDDLARLTNLTSAIDTLAGQLQTGN